MYSKQQKEITLKLYHQTKSVSETVRILEYPTRKNLYNWIYEEANPPKARKEYPIIDTPSNHPRNPPLKIKLDAIHRCFELGENIKYVSEDIGYSRASIYQWRKRYLKEGTTANSDISSEEIKQLKSQMQDMQLEIDLLKESNGLQGATSGIKKQVV